MRYHLFRWINRRALKVVAMKLIERITAPVPSFFKKVRKAGLILAATGGAIVAAPVVLPAVVISIGSYLLVAGTILVAVSQVAVPEAAPQK